MPNTAAIKDYAAAAALSRPRESRQPVIAVLIPCYNEELTVGGADGFALLPRTPGNEKFLGQFAAPDGTHERAMRVR